MNNISFDRRRIFWASLYLVLLLPAVLPLFKESFFAAHDAIWHIARFWQFHLSFSSGQIPVRWAPTLFNGLGYPAFIVNFHLPYYLMEIFFLLGTSLVGSYKILLGFSLVVSGISSYIFLKKLFGARAAFVGSLFFVYSPYRFATVYARGAIGEALAIAIVPFVFWAILVFKDNGRYSKIFFPISIFLLITSHPSIFIIFSPLIIFAILVTFWGNIREFKSILFYFLIGVLSSSFQTLPALFERKYFMFDEVYKQVFYGHFPNLFGVLRIPYSGADIGTPLQVGIFHWIIIIPTILLLINTRERERTILEKFVLICLLFWLVCLFLMSRFSSVLWNSLPFFYTVLYPWRIINILLFASSVFASFLIYRYKNSFVLSVFFVIAIFITSRHFFGWVGKIPADNSYYINYQGTTTAGGEFTPKGLSAQITDYSLPKIELLEGEGAILNERMDNNRWRFDFNDSRDAIIKLAILNFPGWNVSIDGNNTQVIFPYIKEDRDYSGLTVIQVPDGSHTVEAKFKETTLRKIANLITISSFLYLLILVFFRREKSKKL